MAHTRPTARGGVHALGDVDGVGALERQVRQVRRDHCDVAVGHCVGLLDARVPDDGPRASAGKRKLHVRLAQNRVDLQFPASESSAFVYSILVRVTPFI
jgi:hypothetical protein